MTHPCDLKKFTTEEERDEEKQRKVERKEVGEGKLQVCDLLLFVKEVVGGAQDRGRHDLGTLNNTKVREWEDQVGLD